MLGSNFARPWATVLNGQTYHETWPVRAQASRRFINWGALFCLTLAPAPAKEPAAASFHDFNRHSAAASSDSFADQCFFGSPSFCFLLGFQSFSRATGQSFPSVYFLRPVLGSLLGEQQFRVVLLARSCDLSRRDTPTLVRFVCFRARNSLCLVPASKGGFLGSFRCSLLVHPIICKRRPVMTAQGMSFSNNFAHRVNVYPCYWWSRLMCQNANLRSNVDLYFFLILL
jgi:hypothetical protein